MEAYKEKKFNLPEIDGISSKQIEVHLGLYAGYVKHVNKILKDTSRDQERDTDPYILSEAKRRFGFEWNGMRNHEYYFGNLEGGASELPDGKLKEALIHCFSSTEGCIDTIKKTAETTRGNGWVMLQYDNERKDLLVHWVTDHEIGQCTSLIPLIAIDMWEHAYMVDYMPAEKMKYLDAYLSALNWNKIAENFESICS